MTKGSNYQEKRSTWREVVCGTEEYKNAVGEARNEKDKGQIDKVEC